MQISKLLNFVRVATRTNTKRIDVGGDSQPKNHPALLRDGREAKVVLRDLTAESPPLSLSGMCIGKNDSWGPHSEPTDTAALHDLARACSRRSSIIKVSRVTAPSEDEVTSPNTVELQGLQRASSRRSSYSHMSRMTVVPSEEVTPSTAELQGLQRASSRRSSCSNISRSVVPSEVVTTSTALHGLQRASSRRRSSSSTKISRVSDLSEGVADPATSGGQSRRRVHFNPRVKIATTYSDREYDRTALVKGTTARTPPNMFVVAQQMGRFKTNQTRMHPGSFSKTQYPIRVASS